MIDTSQVSIHSWSSYQEKLSDEGWTLDTATFQSTPGLVTRRNVSFHNRVKVIDKVSIHSWSSYQEKQKWNLKRL